MDTNGRIAQLIKELVSPKLAENPNKIERCEACGDLIDVDGNCINLDCSYYNPDLEGSDEPEDYDRGWMFP